jgi:hypothetical protein
MTIIQGFRDEEDGSGFFKTNCLAVMDEVQAKHETVVKYKTLTKGVSSSPTIL